MIPREQPVWSVFSSLRPPSMRFSRLRSSWWCYPEMAFVWAVGQLRLYLEAGRKRVLHFELQRLWCTGISVFSIDGERKVTYSLKPFTSSASSCFRLSAFLCSSSRMDSRNWISSSSRARNWFAERGSLSFKNKQVVDAFGEDAGIHT